MASPFGSLPRGEFTTFQSGRFRSQSQTAMRGLQATAFRNTATAQTRRLSDLQTDTAGMFEAEEIEEDLGFFGSIGSAIDRAPILGGIKNAGGTALEAVLTTLGRPQEAIAGGFLAAQSGTNILTGIKEGFLGEIPDANFATFLEHTDAGIFQNEWVRNIVGFGMGALLDPLNVFAFSKVRHLFALPVKLGARRLGQIPVGASTVAKVTDRILIKPVDRMFGARTGFFGSGPTFRRVKREMIAKGASEEDANKLIAGFRKVVASRGEGDRLAVDEVMNGIHSQSMRTGLSNGLTVEQATRRADRLLNELVTNKDLQAALEKEMINLQRGRVPGVVNEAGSGARWDDAATHIENSMDDFMGAREVDWSAAVHQPTNRPLMSHEMTLSQFDEALRTGSLNDVDSALVESFTREIDQTSKELHHAAVLRAMENGEDVPFLALTEHMDLVNRQQKILRDAGKPSMFLINEESTIGAGDLIRWMQSKFSNVVLDSGEIGAIASIKQDLLGIRVTSGFYMSVYYPHLEDSVKIMNSGIKGLKIRGADSAKAIKLTAQEALDAGLENNILAVIASDIARTRLAGSMAEVVGKNGELLRSLGGRKMTMTHAEVATLRTTFQQTLRRRGLDILEMDRVRAAGASEDDIIRGFARTQDGVLNPDDVKDIKKLLDNTVNGLDEGSWAPDPGGILLDDAELILNSGSDVFNGKSLFAGVSETGEWILPQALAETYAKFGDPLQIGAVLKAIDSFNGLWKPLVTVFPAFLSFFSRNIVGLITNSWLGGMPLKEIILRGRDSARLVKVGVSNRSGTVRIKYTTKGAARVAEREAAAGRTGKVAPEFAMDDVQIVREITEARGINVGASGLAPLDPIGSSAASQFDQLVGQARGALPRPLKPGDRGLRAGFRKVINILRGNKGEIPSSTRMEMMKARLVDYSRNVFQRHGFAPFAWGSTWNQSADNMARYMNIMWRISEGDTIVEASRHAAKWIGDYTELGAATSGIAAVIPFFRWSRFNIPRQLDALISAPYKQSKVALLTGSAAQEESLMAEGESLPEWVLDRHHVTMGRTADGKISILTGLGLPIEDLNKLFARDPFNTVQNLLSELTPILKFWIERSMNMSFFTGKPINPEDGSYSFYKRAWGWTNKLPVLREWLEVQEHVGQNGEVTYTANPEKMHMFASLFGRFGNEADKIGRIVEERDTVWPTVNYLTGLKQHNIFPESPSSVSVQEFVADNPFLAQRYEQYKQIALYPQFNDSAKSAQASRAISKINAMRRLMEAQIGEDVSFEEAAELWAERDQEGAVLALMVKQMGWTKEGAAERRAFKENDVELQIALAQLDPIEFEAIEGFIQENPQ